MGTDPDTGQPITTNEWIDRLAPKALAVVAAGTCATYGGIHAMEGNPTGPWAWRIIWAGTGDPRPACPIVNVPGCPVQPDNMMETLLYLLYQVAGHGADDSAGRQSCGPPGCLARPFMTAATAAVITRRAISRTNTVRPNAWSRSAAGVRW